MVLVRTADVRYLGQGHALSVALPSGRFDDAMRADIARQFDELHMATYLHNAPDEPKELVSLRLSAMGEVANPTLPLLAQGQGEPTVDSQIGERPVYFGGRCTSWAIFDRERLRAGNVISGPAVIEEEVSTTLVLPGQRLAVDDVGNLILSEEGSAA
jgi:N-methylhydantoinase A